VIVKSAHELSRRHNIDPAYSVKRAKPSPRGLSLFSSKATGPFWLYGQGDLEAYLLARMRREGFSGCYEVFHPGLFARFHPTLILRKSFRLSSLPKDGRVAVYHSGDLRLKLNDRIALHVQGARHPVKRTINALPYLRKGKNEIYVTLNRIDEPPTFLMASPFVETDACWSAGWDGFHWQVPACFPFEGAKRFPHQERLPCMTIKPRAIEGNVYDFGVELLGKPAITLSAGKGKVRIHPGESLAEAKDRYAKHREQYVPSLKVGAGAHAAEGEAAGRYLRVSPSGNAKVDAVELLGAFYPTRYRGAFACSDERLTKIWMHSAYTLRLCMRELFVDGIKRDRMPWVGDAYLSGLCNAYSFGEKAIAERTLTALHGERPEECHFNGIIEYTLFWVMALEKHLLFFGDVNCARRMWAKVKSLIDVLAKQEDEDGFLVADKSTWLLIDWAHIEKSGAVSALQMIYVMCLQSAARLAAAFNDDKAAARLGRKAARLQKKCRKFFWSDLAGGFVDNFAKGKQGKHITRHANFLAILSGTATRRQRKSIVEEVLLNDKAPRVGTPYMMCFEGMALAQCGLRDRMLETVREYWGGMLDEGATTFWEAYDPNQSGKEHYSFYGRPFGKSLCHAWSAGPVYLLSGELLGLRPLEAGWKRFAFAPQPCGLEWMCVSVPTPLGEIELKMERGKGELKVPNGAVMQIAFPEAGRLTHKGPRSISFDVPA